MTHKAKLRYYGYGFALGILFLYGNIIPYTNPQIAPKDGVVRLQGDIMATVLYVMSDGDSRGICKKVEWPFAWCPRVGDYLEIELHELLKVSDVTQLPLRDAIIVKLDITYDSLTATAAFSAGIHPKIKAELVAGTADRLQKFRTRYGWNPIGEDGYIGELRSPWL